jgi:major vault protein
MIIVPPRHYVIVENPVIRKITYDKEGREVSSVVITDDHGQVLLRHGDREVRLEQPPFPLYDGEKCGPVKPLIIVEKDTALRLKAHRDFEDRYNNGIKRHAGEEWLFHGRATYHPQVEVDVIETITAQRLKPTEALRIRAIRDCVDYQGKERKAGEEWLVKKEGLYLPGANEQIVERVKGTILTDKNAIHVRAKNKFTDEKGVEHKAGSEWLFTKDDKEIYYPDVHEEIVKHEQLVILGSHDYCIIDDPVDENGKPQLGSKKMTKGTTSFFIKPGETLKERKKSTLLAPNEGIWVTAKEEFRDEYRVTRRPGDCWIVCGPTEYWTPMEARITHQVKAVIAIESLGFYIFRPVLFFGSLFGLLLLVYLVSRYVL